MPLSKIRKATAVFVAAVQCVVSSLVIMPTQLWAQSTDIDAPEIELIVVEEGVKGETQVFSASITDATGVTSATLHYRMGSDGAFIGAPMSIIAGTDIYSASVDTTTTTASLVQYYIEARDEGGNRSVEGFAFDPLQRLLTEGTSVASGPELIAPPRESMSRTKKIVYGVLGLLAVGVLAGSAGGSSGGGGNTGATGPDIPLTVTVDPL